jgi:hypothetical protein
MASRISGCCSRMIFVFLSSFDRGFGMLNAFFGRFGFLLEYRFSGLSLFISGGSFLDCLLNRGVF